MSIYLSHASKDAFDVKKALGRKFLRVSVSRANEWTEFEKCVRAWSKDTGLPTGWLDRYVENRVRFDVIDEPPAPIVLDSKPPAPTTNERELAMQTFGQHPQHVQKAALAEMVALWIRAKTDDPIEREQLLAEHVEAVRDLTTRQEH
jgi:hypothetical protein